MENHYDVIVVGAGPAGSTTAMCIARAGYKVLMIEKNTFPRDKSCGDGLTRMSSRLIHELGILDSFSSFRKIKGVKVYIDKQGVRQFDYPEDLEEPCYGLVVPRFQLDSILCQKAVESGVVLLEKTSCERLLYDEKNNKVIGIKFDNNSEIFADIVIGADGSASTIAYQANLATTPKNKMGFGLRGYFSGIEDLSEILEIYLPILDTSEKRVLPSYGWVFPVTDNMANIGVGLIEKTDKDNIRSVMDGFVQKLKADKRFEHIKIEGDYLGAPMRFDFNPKKSFAPGLLLVGDAAGMISPFTGEGIGYAIETGIIAANSYIEQKNSANADFTDLTKYGNALAGKFQGYFETGSATVNRYHLIWKVLKNTFQNDRPLFAIIRQATLFPEGIGESFFVYSNQDVSNQIKSNYGELRTDILTISENLINITREDWPFLSRLFSAAQITPGIPFRPSLFLLLAGYLFSPDRNVLVRLGTSIELGYAATMCHSSVIEDNSDNPVSNLNWGNMLSILVGDFLLSKSYEIIANLEGDNARIISEAMALSTKGYVTLRKSVENNIKSISIEDYLNIIYMKNSSSFELCVHLGSVISKAEVKESNSLKQYGKYFGAAYQIIEDILQTYDNKLINTNGIYSGIENEIITLPYILLKKDDSISPRQDEIEKCIKISFEVAKKEMSKAISCLDSIKESQIKESIINISNFIIHQGEINIQKALN
jgi:geranylgeranyl reductase family protein